MSTIHVKTKSLTFSRLQSLHRKHVESLGQLYQKRCGLGSCDLGEQYLHTELLSVQNELVHWLCQVFIGARGYLG